MRRLIALIVALLMLGGGMLGVTVAQEATPAADGSATMSAARTNVRYILPYTGNQLNPNLTVSGTEQGSCLHESLASPDRPDAWACITDGTSLLLDPCFENSFALPDEPGELACLASPFTQDVILFTPTAPLPRVKDTEADLPPGHPKADSGSPAMADAPLPWAFELAGGEQCTIATGATAVFAGMRVNYFCAGSGSILGRPDQTDPVWTVNYLADGALMTDLVDVVTVWH